MHKEQICNRHRHDGHGDGRPNAHKCIGDQIPCFVRYDGGPHSRRKLDCHAEQEDRPSTVAIGERDKADAGETESCVFKSADYGHVPVAQLQVLLELRPGAMVDTQG